MILAILFALGLLLIEIYRVAVQQFHGFLSLVAIVVAVLLIFVLLLDSRGYRIP